MRVWLARHPRWAFHFTPTSTSWINAVEGFFAELTERPLKRGVFKSIIDLQAAINQSSPRPTMFPDSSPGPLIRTKLSPPSGVGTNC